MSPSITGRTIVAGVAGSPVTHTLSPLLHNAWLRAAGIDAVYVAFSPAVARFGDFARGLRRGAVRGLNVTVPFKLEALALADSRTARAEAAGAANVLVFEDDGAIVADNTDGEGLLAAFAEQAVGFDPTAGPTIVLGAGGAARGAAAAFLEAGAPEVRILNRSVRHAEELRDKLGSKVCTFATGSIEAFDDANAVINATTLGLGGGGGPDVAFDELPRAAIVMDMVYQPLETDFLRRARSSGLRVVDGLAMLIGQARPSYRAFFGAAPPDTVDVRALALAALEAQV